MKVQVVYDEHGDIVSGGVAASGLQGQVRLRPQPGQSVSEVDVPDLDEASILSPAGVGVEGQHKQLAGLLERCATQLNKK